MEDYQRGKGSFLSKMPEGGGGQVHANGWTRADGKSIYMTSIDNPMTHAPNIHYPWYGVVNDKEVSNPGRGVWHVKKK